ncbi:MAG: ABC transporter ATP-binding protein [Bacilli bacterium]|nr:ABC transporter ATP-binding protein [Bacilli bacterium]
MFKILKKLNKKEMLYILFCLIFVVIQVWLDLKLPDYMSNITSLLTQNSDKMGEIVKQGAYMMGCAFGSLISAFIVGYFASNISASFSKRLRREVFSKVEDFGMEEIKKFSTSSLITRTTNDVTQVQMLIVMGLQMIMKAPILAGWAIFKIVDKSWQWSIVTAVAVVLLLVMITILILFALPKFKIIQTLTDNLNRITRENLTGIRVVRAFNAEKYQEKKFEVANKELTSTHLFTGRVMSVMSPWMTLLMSSLSLSIYFIGAKLINEADMMSKLGLFSDMVVFSSYAMQVVMAFMMLIVIFILYPRASVSAKRILEVLELNSSIRDPHKDFNNKSDEVGTIEFRHVGFKYPDAEEYMLENISFKVNKGETVAFIGSTGSGKSTLINLIPRFYDATEGEVLIDGIDVKKYKQRELRNKLGYIPQKAVIFTGTINSNVSYGVKDNYKITDEVIKKAISVAQGKSFVEKMEDKYNSHISQGGTNLSGGQKQRLAIARAIARNPEIYIFDDSFSALDYKTDLTLRRELKKHTKDATVLIVAQRIGTIKHADKIVVLDNGEMVGIGTHEELLKSCQVYQEIAYSQLSKEELENER